MPAAPTPKSEAKRLQTLKSYQVLDTLQEEVFDEITRMAAEICETPTAIISLVDENRQWFKSRVGIDAEQTPRDVAFCAHALLSHDILEIPDATLDERFKHNPLVVGEPHIRFYAGAPLIAHNDEVVGTLCVISPEPKQLDDKQKKLLSMLARSVISQFELIKKGAQLRRKNDELKGFSYAMAQDMSVPLEDIQRLLKIMQPDCQTLLPEYIQQCFDIVVKKVSKSRSILNDVLDYTNSTFVCEQAEVFELSDMMNELRHFVEFSDSFLIRVKPMKVTLPQAALASVMYNLITNTIAYHDKLEGTIDIDVDEHASEYVIKVHDDGPGFDKNRIPTAFQLVEMVQTSAQRHTSAIGLAATKKLIERYGGSVFVESGHSSSDEDGISRGRTFVIHWPKAVYSQPVE